MVAALIIATGKTMHKSGFHPLQAVGSIPALQRIILTFQQAGIQRIAVVCHGDKDPAEKAGSGMGAVFLHGRKEADMFENVKLGLRYLQGKCGAAFVSHADVPLFSGKTLDALLKADGEVRVPAYQGKPGHPALLRAEHFPAILAYEGEGGLAGAIRAAGLTRRLVEVEDGGILANLQGGDLPGSLISQHTLMQLHPNIRIRLAKEKPFYGPGAHQLLQLTEETGSLSEACQRMGISYTKGRRMIATMEEQLGYPVVESKQGGPAGGGSAVTPEGKALMDSYKAYCGEATACLQRLFEKYFPDGLQGGLQ